MIILFQQSSLNGKKLQNQTKEYQAQPRNAPARYHNSRVTLPTGFGTMHGGSC